MNIEKKIQLVKKTPTEEILTDTELINMFERTSRPKHYIGLEISGKIHLGTGLICMMKVKDFQEAGLNCNILLADWHTWINRKLGGDLDVIKDVAVGYFTEGLKSTLKAIGADPNSVNFILGSDLYHNNDQYWQNLIEISKNITLNRIKRATTIMGRKFGEDTDFAQLLYPPMQINDIFELKADLVHSGLDQRKAHVLAREITMKAHNQKVKPTVVHHSLILGLQKPPVWPLPLNTDLKQLLSENKMSKSVQNTAVFIHDSPEIIEKKIMKGFCPEKSVELNPILDWIKNIVFHDQNNSFTLHRPSKYGGEISYYSYKELENDYKNGLIHPLDLKKAISSYLIKILEPVRKHFASKTDLLDVFDKINITR